MNQQSDGVKALVLPPNAFIPSDILLIAAPSFFKNSANDREGALLPRIGHLLMGDQDYEPTHSIFYLKEALKNFGIKAVSVDINLLNYMKTCGYSVDVNGQLSDLIKKTNPAAIGISSMRSNFIEAIKLSSTIRNLGFTGKIILGGSATGDKNLKWSNHFTEIIPDQTIFDVIEKIASIFHQKKSTFNRQKSYTRPIPDYSDIPKEAPLIPRFFLNFGCSNGCEYCFPSAIRNFKTEHLDVNYITNFIRSFNEQYDFDFFLIGDLTYFLQSPSIKNQLKAFSSFKLKPWWCQTQARFIDKNTAIALSKASCKQVAFAAEGFETKNASIRTKNPNINFTINRLKILGDQGIDRQLYWMFGLPDDTIENCKKRLDDINLLVSNNLVESIHLSYLIPYPGTVYGDTPQNFGIIIEKSIDQHYNDVTRDFYEPLPMHRTSHMTSEQIMKYFTEAKLIAKASLEHD